MINKSFFAFPLLPALLFPNSVFGQAQEAAVAATDVAAEHCGISGASWIAGEQQASLASDLDAPLRAELSGSGPFTRVFTLETATTLRLEASAKSAGDPVLRLYTAEGSLIAENDDAVGSLDSQLIENLDPGTYCLQADDLRGTADLTVQIGPESAPPLLVSRELVCGPQTEATSFGGAALEAAIKTGALRASADAAQNSYLRFTVAAATSLSLRADGGAGIDPRITLFDADGRTLAANDDADGVSARLDFQPELAAGTYCLGVQANEAKPGSITVTAETIDVESYKKRAYLRGQLVPLSGDHPVKPLQFNHTQGEIVLQGAGVSWFSFDLKEPSLVGIRSHGTLSGADTLLRLFDGEGELVVENDDQDGNRNARIAPVHLSAGRYFLALSDHQANEAAGSPLRPVSILAERFIRAPAE